MPLRRHPHRPPGPQLQVHLQLSGPEGARHWQADVVDPAAPRPLHFDSLPELIRWLSQLQWSTTPAGGLK